MKKCIHDKLKFQCKDCKGSSICIHDKVKNSCKKCGGSRFCIHEKEKTTCKDCGGSQICLHNKVKSKCKDCKGGSICLHDKIRSTCNICSKSKFCIHEKIKQICKECHGTAICMHEKERSYCRICNPTNFCEHDRRKNQCKDCSVKLCIHNIKISDCITCAKSVSYCIHNKNKSICIDCGGSQICIHNKRKTRCKLCDGKDLCKTEWCETYISTISKNKYEGYCLFCFIHLFPEKPIARNYKTKEFEVVKFITTQFSVFSWITDKTIKDGCSKKRPDLLLDLGYQVIIIEIDENQHTSYDCSCENKRIMELSQDIGHRPIIFIRFNPDDYIDEDNNSIKSCWHINKTGFCQINKTKIDEWEFRLDILKQQIDYWTIPENKTEKTIEIVELFYDN
jgi:hypothetical protein